MQCVFVKANEMQDTCICARDCRSLRAAFKDVVDAEAAAKTKEKAIKSMLNRKYANYELRNA